MDVNINNDYSRAFLKVANILAPTTTFNKLIITQESTDEGDKEVLYTAKGFDCINNHDVEVTTELNPTKGRQLVTRFMDDNGNVFYEYRCWYHSFNWKGLMATTDTDKYTWVYCN